MSLTESPFFTDTSSPLKSASGAAGVYVLAIAALPSHYAASSSAPFNAIHLFDKTSFHSVHNLDGHAGGTTSLRAVDAVASSTRRALVSCGNDGTVKVWDERTGAAGIQSTSVRASPRPPLTTPQ